VVTETRALARGGELVTGRYAYVIGFIALALGAALALVFHPFLAAKALFLLILAAVTIAAWYGGLVPGLAFTLLAALVSEQILAPEQGSYATDPASVRLRFALLLIEGVLASILGSQLRRARPERPAAAPAPSSERGARALQPELEILNRLGLTLAGQLDMERLVQAVTDAGVAITGAAYGGFLYRNGTNVANQYVAGAPCPAFVDFPLFQDSQALGEPFIGVLRSDDLDARFDPLRVATVRSDKMTCAKGSEIAPNLQPFANFLGSLLRISQFETDEAT
jgi:hypothetical protein